MVTTIRVPAPLDLTGLFSLAAVDRDNLKYTNFLPVTHPHLAEVETAADHVLVHAYGGYTTNLPLADLLDGQAWIAHSFDGDELAAEHGGPARLLVPHLYLWKSAKWVRGLSLTAQEEPGFWETAGYHLYGDPWREQRYWGD